jgi:23S rRNA (adenine2503-C2)-methyltransferase
VNFVDIKTLTADELKEWLASAGHKAYRVDQVRGWLFRQRARSFNEMVNVPPALREQLAAAFKIQSLTVASESRSVDGTIKWLYRTHDGHHIETVMIPTETRGSVCVSTQVGCAMGCTFCRTAKMGFIRHLEAGEILEQILRVMWHFADEGLGRDVTNIIFMGMGEPLMNLEQVHRTCVTLHDQKLFNLGRKRMTVSTSGVVPRIAELVDRGTPCCLAVSLNSTNDAMRSSVMPVNKSWNLEKLFEAIDDYIRRTDESVTLEFVLIKDVTCTVQSARELLKLTQQRKVKVNAIVLNDGDDPALQPPSQDEIDQFLEIVRAGNVIITLRNPRGRDIQAACGQLAYKQQRNTEC